MNIFSVACLSAAKARACRRVELESLEVKKTEISSTFTRPGLAQIIASKNLHRQVTREPSNKNTDSPLNCEPQLRAGWPGSGSPSGASVRAAAGTECACSPRRHRHKQRLKPPQTTRTRAECAGKVANKKCVKTGINARC